MSLQFLSSVSKATTGLAGSTTVTPQTTNGGAAPTTDAGATVGTVYETSTPGTYICLVTYPNADLSLPLVPWVHWNINGTLVDDFAPLPLFQDTVFITGPYKQGVASPILFYLVSSLDKDTPITGATVTVQRALGGASYTSATGTVTEIGNGGYRLNASAADMSATDILFRFTAAGADNCVIPVNTTP